MKIDKSDVLKIMHFARENIREFPNTIYWESGKELDHADKVAISWIKAISNVLKLDIDVKIKDKR